tara:strand:- start:21334 stop:21717 length:384 start_codon:yes stop_codon:yes gene_type:complete
MQKSTISMINKIQQKYGCNPDEARKILNLQRNLKANQKQKQAKERRQLKLQKKREALDLLRKKHNCTLKEAKLYFDVEKATPKGLLQVKVMHISKATKLTTKKLNRTKRKIKNSSVWTVSGGAVSPR